MTKITKKIVFSTNCGFWIPGLCFFYRGAVYRAPAPRAAGNNRGHVNYFKGANHDGNKN